MNGHILENTAHLSPHSRKKRWAAPQDCFAVESLYEAEKVRTLRRPGARQRTR